MGQENLDLNYALELILLISISERTMTSTSKYSEFPCLMLLRFTSFPGVVLVSLLLTLNIFHTFALVFLLLTLNMKLPAGL